MATRLRESIFELIQSLTRSEKRYFKLYASRHASIENNVNIKLFELIDELDHYDEQLIFERLQGDACLNRFVITKKRLYDLILASLDAFHASTSVDAQLYRLIHSADILRSKCLYDQSKKVLRSAAKLAIKYERKAICIEISQKMKSLLETMECAEIRQLCENESLFLTELQQMNEIQIRLIEDPGDNSPEQMSRAFSLDRDVSHRVLNNNLEVAATLRSGNIQDAVVWLQNSLETYEENNHLISENPLSYLRVLAELGHLQLRMGHWDEAQISLLKLENYQQALICIDNPELCRYLELVVSRMTLEQKVRRGQLDSTSEELSGLLTLASNELHIEHRAVIQMFVAGIFLNSSELTKARKLLNKVIARGVKNLKNEAWKGCALVMKLIIELETEPAHFVIQTVKSIRRQLIQTNQCTSSVKLFLSYAQKITKAVHPVQKQELWKELSEELMTCAPPQEHFDLVYFDLRSWALSKASNGRYSATLSERNVLTANNALRISA